MTQVGELVAVLIDIMQKDAKCEYKPDDHEWHCNLEGDGGRLRTNLAKHLGVVEPKQVTSIDDVSATAWPSQAHHLIPWQQLKGHPVTQWLAESPPKGAGKMFADSGYDVDHGNNGKFMPYSSALKEWAVANAAEKTALSRKVMALAAMQLHQGPHSTKGYGVGECGYKTRVGEYLDAINNHALSHFAAPAQCADCEGKKQNGKYPPRRNIVRYLDRASTYLEVDINLMRIYVSRRAAGFGADGGIMY